MCHRKILRQDVDIDRIVEDEDLYYTNGLAGINSEAGENKRRTNASYNDINDILPQADIVGLLPDYFCFSSSKFAAQYAVRLDYGPDEPYHVEYIYSLADHHRLPDRTDTHLVQHPPVYYALMAGLWQASGATQRPLSVTPGPHALGALEPRSVLARRLIRFASTLIGIATLLVLARLMMVMQVSRPWIGAILCLVATGPMFQYISAVVNNEGFSVLYASLSAWAIVSRLQSGRCTVRDAVLIGLLVGGGVWVKQTMLFAAPLAWWMLWTTGERDQRVTRLGIFLIAALAVGVWWPLHNHLVAGQWFPCYTIPSNQFQQAANAERHPLVLLGWLWNILQTNYLPDWAQLFLPGTLATLAALALVALVLGLFLAGIRDADKSRRQLRAMALAGMMLLLAGVLQYCLHDDFRAQIGGRYLLNGIPWLVVLLGASVPKRPDTAAKIPTWLVGTLAVLTLFDAAWWFLVFVFYTSAGHGT